MQAGFNDWKVNKNYKISETCKAIKDKRNVINTIKHCFQNQFEAGVIKGFNGCEKKRRPFECAGGLHTDNWGYLICGKIYMD